MTAGADIYIQALALGLDPAWRRRTDEERHDDGCRFRDAAAAAEIDGARTITYSSVGLEPSVDVLLWRMAPSVDTLEEGAARLLGSGIGRWLTVTHSFIGRIAPSQYVRAPTDQEQSPFDGERSRYLIVYPFTKSTDWYLLSKEARQGVMNEHMRVGHGYPQVRQALAYSFGLDSQDFVVAYETDDLIAFGDLVRALRATESRRSTVSDSPILPPAARRDPRFAGCRLMAIPHASARTAGLVERAELLFPGGVNSPVRAFRSVGRPPLVLERGDGPHVWDADGRPYLDYIGAWGAAILGHGHPRVARAVSAAAAGGLALGATHPFEIELGEAIQATMPSIERLRFTSSGTEAVMSAIRVARAATGRDLIVTFAGAYHGHADGLLVEAGSGVATLAISGSRGVPEAVAAQTIVLPFNDASAVALAFERHRARIAAVIAEPVIANSGVIPPMPGFLEQIRQMTQADGALLIFDEVITGFRLGRGGAQERFGIRPDLTILGKVIGGGMPIGAYGGRAELLQLVAPAGPVYQAGTLSGHPLSMAAGLATLAELTPDRYAELVARVATLADGLADAAAQAGAPAAIARFGPLLTVFFRSKAPRDGAEALDSDRAAYALFFRAMLDAGVLLPPSQFEAWFPSMAHGAADVADTIDAARTAFAAVWA
jgi:glutamate-1-semialdehyde 2,1-aminomutase